MRTAVNHFLDEFARGSGSHILTLAASRMVSNLQISQVVEIPTLQDVEENIQRGKDDPNSIYYYTPREFNGLVKVNKNSCIY